MSYGLADSMRELDVYLISPVPRLSEALRQRGWSVFECTPEVYDSERTAQLHKSSRITVIPVHGTSIVPGKAFTAQVRRARRLVKAGDHRIVALFLKPSPGFSIMAATRINAYVDREVDEAAQTISDMLVSGPDARPSGANVRVFLSYRRGGLDAMATGRLREHILQAAGKRDVFLDVESIPPGVDFSSCIRETLEGVRVLLAVVGPDWRPNRLHDTDDWVRLELTTAFKLGTPIIPVLLESTSMPAGSALPADLDFFPRLQALRLRGDPDFGRDAQRIVNALNFATR